MVVSLLEMKDVGQIFIITDFEFYNSEKVQVSLKNHTAKFRQTAV